eukprot:NODE_10_length_61504_cov_0.956502.p5 type:complete len:599 gc:universal NODE_10_length_61504_cov_0.956502:51766-49970(-)
MVEFTQKADLSLYENKDTEQYCAYLEAVLENFDEEPYSNLFLDDSEDEKYILLENIYEYIVNDIVAIAVDKKGSKLYEKILERSTITQVLLVSEKLFDVELLELLCFNRFCSYSIQRIIKIYGLILGLSHVKFDISKAVGRYLKIVTNLAVEKIDDFTKSPFANHILRELMLSLSKSDEENLNVIIELVYKQVDFTWADDPKLCSLLQNIFDLDRNLADKFMQNCCDEIKDSFKLWVLKNSSCFLIEKLITFVSKENLIKIYNLIYKNNMKAIASNDNATFSVKHLLNRLIREEMFSEIELLFFEILEEKIFWNLLNTPHFGTALKFTDSLLNFSTELQTKLIDTLIIIGNEREGGLFFNLACANTEQPQMAGSLLLQSILSKIDLEKSEILKSLLDVELSLQLRLLKEKSASHAFDSFFNSRFIKTETKLSFFDKYIVDNEVDLVLDRYACRVLESSWSYLDMQRKLKFMESIKSTRNELVKSPSGRKFAKFSSIDAYKRDPHQWRRLEVSKMRNLNIFKDIIKDKTPRLPEKTVYEVEIPKPSPATTVKEMGTILEAIKESNPKNSKRKSEKKDKKLKKKKRKVQQNDEFQIEVLE